MLTRAARFGAGKRLALSTPARYSKDTLGVLTRRALAILPESGALLVRSTAVFSRLPYASEQPEDDAN